MFWIWRFSKRKLGGKTVVGQDSADPGGGDEDIFGPFRGEELRHGGRVEQVQFSAGFADEAGKALAAKFAPNGAADHAAVAGDINARVRFHFGTGWNQLCKKPS